MKQTTNFLLSLVALLLFQADLSYGQPKTTIVEQPYYIDANSSIKEVNTIDRKFVNIQYQDKVGDGKALELRVISWKGEEIANYSLSKSYGFNYYTISIEDYFEEWTVGDIYKFHLKDGQLLKNNILVRKVEISKDNLPVPNIVINPLNLDCEGLEGSTVDFYGEIIGGKAPYSINWFVMNIDRTQLLYQPKAEKIEAQGKTSAIRVDINPEYNIILFVVDACGNEAEQILTVNCPKDKTKINSLFWHPIKPIKESVKNGNSNEKI